jgi:hypothetical protein
MRPLILCPKDDLLIQVCVCVCVCVCVTCPRVCSVGCSHNPVLLVSVMTRVTPSLSLVQQQLLIFPEHLSSPEVFSRVCVAES